MNEIFFHALYIETWTSSKQHNKTTTINLILFLSFAVVHLLTYLLLEWHMYIYSIAKR